MLRITLIGIASLFLFNACSPKIPFTQEVRDQYRLTPEELIKIQFYISDPLTLRRGTENDKKKTEDGTLIVQTGKQIDQVRIKAETPGAVHQVVDNQRLAIAFEDGAENFLVFGSGRGRNGLYYLQAMDWNQGRGKVSYGGQIWYTNTGSDNAILLFKMKSIRDLRVNEKVAKGKKVN